MKRAPDPAWIQNVQKKLKEEHNIQHADATDDWVFRSRLSGVRDPNIPTDYEEWVRNTIRKVDEKITNTDLLGGDKTVPETIHNGPVKVLFTWTVIGRDVYAEWQMFCMEEQLGGQELGVVSSREEIDAMLQTMFCLLYASYEYVKKHFTPHSG